MPGHLEWERDQRADVSSVEELDAVLFSIAQRAAGTRAIAVELFMDDETGICITVGDDASMVCFYSKRGDPLVVNARGLMADEAGVQEGEELFVFSYGGEYSEALRRETIPTEVAREGMRLYFLTGSRPANIAWEE